MTYNIPATIWNLLVWAFFAVVIAGVALTSYAAIKLREAQEAAAAATTPPAGPDPEEYHVVEDEAPVSAVSQTDAEPAASEAATDSSDD